MCDTEEKGTATCIRGSPLCHYWDSLGIGEEKLMFTLREWGGLERTEIRVEKVKEKSIVYFIFM